MSTDSSGSIQVAQHTLRISDPGVSLPFYRDKLGMTLLAQRVNGDDVHYFLGFVDHGVDVSPIDSDPSQWQSRSFLELVHSPQGPKADIRPQPDADEGYWKIAISVSELDIARNRLVANGVDVDSPRQVGDIAYLCHFNDPDGYCIELIQHDFLQNHQSAPENFDYALGSCPAFLLITYRVKDVEASLQFYDEVLGMKLLSVQTVEARGFTLYFLACTDESPPNSDVNHVGNREWLWQRSYCVVELQHIWGTESKSDFEYRVGAETGFMGVSFAVQNIDDIVERSGTPDSEVESCDFDQILQTRTATVLDPDGFSMRLIEKAAIN
jgi:lactoylglutathione lyase